MLPELLNQIPTSQDFASVTADGAYDTRNCHRRPWFSCHPPAAQECPAMETYHPGAIARNEAVNAPRYPGRTI
ncbi:hypothetical protein GGR93_002705 [Sulfitobacter noctilucicola]|uniref:Transposase DDE domain-containing protein n=1 Tax=Sulfitobacter noctilucicola TaxID=1342301 RepID=A0A7W6MB18_9RHOB|nr:hypothetical protein [Sulfitobacter noctilucicola]